MSKYSVDSKLSKNLPLCVSICDCPHKGHREIGGNGLCLLDIHIPNGRNECTAKVDPNAKEQVYFT